MTLESIRENNSLTPNEKIIEEKIFVTAFTRNDQENIFRLLAKFADRYNSIKHYAYDRHLEHYLSEFNDLLNK